MTFFYDLTYDFSICLDGSVKCARKEKIWQEKNHTLILIFVIPISVFTILIREVSIYVNELAFQ